MSDALHEGGCQCGAHRFQAQGAPRFVSRCHCASCRKAVGAEFITWVGFKNDQVNWNTPPANYASSDGVRRGFCQSCGAALTFQGVKWAGETHLVIGAFDHPEKFPPKNNSFPDEALPWVDPKIYQ